MLIERSRLLLGIVTGTALVGAGVLAMTMQSGALSAGEDVVVELADANRVQAGAPARIAGVRVGQVMGVELAEDRVRVTVRTTEPLPVDSRARITTTNALGARAVTFEPGEDWDTLLTEQEDPVIPLDRTRSFVDLPDVTDETVDFLEASDTEAAARLFTSLADVTDDQNEELGALLDGLESVSTVVEENRRELEAFLDDTGELIDVLNESDRDLVRTLDSVGETVASLTERREDLLELVRSTADFSSTTADLVVEERESIDAILDEMAALLAVVDDHQVDIAHLLAYGGVSFEGFSTVAESQGQDNPYWGDIFTTSAGEAGVDVLAGCGGLIDEVLDQLLGPGPECAPEEEGAGPEEGDDEESPQDGDDGGDGDGLIPELPAGPAGGAGDAGTVDADRGLAAFLGGDLAGGGA